MKRILFFALTLVLTLPLGLQAQESPKAMSKELKQIMRDLSPEQQQRVLAFARQQQELQMRAQTQAEVVTAPDQPQAKPAPQPAQPAVLELQPAQSMATMNIGTQTEPVRPAWLEEAETMAHTTVEWAETTYDFGQIEPGSKVKHTFTFRNTGEHPLKITRVKPSCGCTSPDWSREEIAPGEEGFVEVVFNSAGKSGMQHKTVTVTGNFDPMNMVLRFKGEITAATGQ
ncbi:MAG: DUF1573 domain-containing protein [Bacteroidetes bacterium]|nr:MAG: DUF1573 domain-containing protein [Bacteroidota bacterium]